MSQAINSYKYENEINFNVEDTKNAIKKILSMYPTRFIYDVKDLNDAFGTYKFGEIKCSYLITLTKLNDTTTKIVVTCSERPGSFHPGMASLESYTSEFLTILSTVLSGASTEEIQTVVNANNSDSGVSNISCIITLIGIALAAYAFLSCLM